MWQHVIIAVSAAIITVVFAIWQIRVKGRADEMTLATVNIGATVFESLSASQDYYHGLPPPDAYLIAIASSAAIVLGLTISLLFRLWKARRSSTPPT